MRQHILIAHGIRMRHCHYCSRPVSTAFYLPFVKGWACVACYVQHVVVPSGSDGALHQEEAQGGPSGIAPCPSARLGSTTVDQVALESSAVEPLSAVA